jgi:hypothetical protein
MKETLRNFELNSPRPFRLLDILVKMISMSIKSTRLSSLQKKKFLTVLGLLNGLQTKLEIETIEEDPEQSKENSKRKWNAGVKIKETEPQ